MLRGARDSECRVAMEQALSSAPEILLSWIKELSAK